LLPPFRLADTIPIPKFPLCLQHELNFISSLYYWISIIISGPRFQIGGGLLRSSFWISFINSLFSSEVQIQGHRLCMLVYPMDPDSCRSLQPRQTYGSLNIMPEPPKLLCLTPTKRSGFPALTLEQTEWLLPLYYTNLLTSLNYCYPKD